jgi:predicted RNA-binding protein with RPS1 domain
MSTLQTLKAELQKMHAEAMKADRDGRISFQFKRVTDAVVQHAKAGKTSVSVMLQFTDIKHELLERVKQRYPDSMVLFEGESLVVDWT